MHAQGGGDGEVQGVREAAQGEVDAEVGGSEDLLGASHALGAEDDGEAFGDDVDAVGDRGGGAKGGFSHRDRRLGQIRGPDHAAVLAESGDARGCGGELADGGELVGATREELVGVAPGLAVTATAPARGRAAATGGASVGRGGLGREVLVATLHDGVHEPDVLHAERLGGAYHRAVVVLVRAPLDDAHHPGGATMDGGLRLAKEPVWKSSGVHIVRVGVDGHHRGPRCGGSRRRREPRESRWSPRLQCSNEPERANLAASVARAFLRS